MPNSGKPELGGEGAHLRCRDIGACVSTQGRRALMRVVGGRLKGRNLASPSSRDIRPTADRLRESLFNILIHAYDDPIADARVLDLFAGTGALGIEAISRGAAFALFVDNGARRARCCATMSNRWAWEASQKCSAATPAILARRIRSSRFRWCFSIRPIA